MGGRVGNTLRVTSRLLSPEPVTSLDQHVQAGGGTVADAQPAYEYNESVNKAKAVFRAVELATEQPEWP